MSQKAPNTPQLDGQESNLHLLVALRKLRRANVRLQRAADDAKKREYKWRAAAHASYQRVDEVHGPVAMTPSS